MKYLPTLLASFIQQGYNIKTLNEQTYVWDYPLNYADGSKRLQIVYLGESSDNQNQDILFIRSLVANFTEQLNPIVLLREADYCQLSSICLKSYPGADGNMVEGVYVQSAPDAQWMMENQKMFEAIIHEVANRADFIEKRYLNIDNR